MNCSALADDDVGFDDQSHLEPTTGFDFVTVARELGEVEEEIKSGELGTEEIDAAIKLFKAFLRWQWQGGMRNEKGFAIRGKILCWLFLEQLRPYSMTRMANWDGRDKQAWDRWVQDFNKTFPGIVEQLREEFKG